jgi:hypothetical protein
LHIECNTAELRSAPQSGDYQRLFGGGGDLQLLAKEYKVSVTQEYKIFRSLAQNSDYD